MVGERWIGVGWGKKSILLLTVAWLMLMSGVAINARTTSLYPFSAAIINAVVSYLCREPQQQVG